MRPRPSWSRLRRRAVPTSGGHPVYGGFFWINGDGFWPVPRDAYLMSGAFGKKTMIIPSHDLVVVRLGHDKGAVEGNKSFQKALALLMEAVPSSGAASPKTTKERRISQRFRAIGRGL
jgi:CubicO group peptidase (beta-lactamase class C family)